MAHLPLPWRRALVRARLVLETLQGLGPRTAGLVVVNSARCQVAAWRARRVGVEGVIGEAPGRLTGVDSDATGARFVFEKADLEVRFLAADVVRLSWGPGPAPVPYALADVPVWPRPAMTAGVRADGGRDLATTDLVVSVDGEGSVRVLRPDGSLVRSEAPPRRRAGAWDLRHSMRPGERFSGLGEQAAGVDLRGGSYRLWNRDAGGSWSTGRSPLYLGVPVVVGTHPDGAVLTFYENSTDAIFCFGEPGLARRAAGTASVTFAGGVLRHYLAVGTVDHVLDRYSELTGRPALPPRWALGYHQSRWGYRTEAEVRAVVDGYRALGVPLSAVHLDIDYMDGYRVFTFDRDRFPDPVGLSASLWDCAVRLVAIVDPGIKEDPGYEVYREGREQGRFCTDPAGHLVQGVVWPGRVVFPDFTDPGTRSWWAARYRVLTDAGISGVWHDMNEPTSISLLGDPSLPLGTRHDFDGRGGDHAEGHNLYGLLMNRAGFEGLARARPDRRPFIVSRSGWAGMQRWAWSWTGDVTTTWASLRQQIATVIGLGLSGVPYSGSDIGGFSGVPDDELYVRWLQMSVLLPYCRTHSVVGAPPREPWRFPEPARRTISAWLRFRYRILPYLYTLAHDATTTGAPLVRPWWWPPPGTVGPGGARLVDGTGPVDEGGDVDDVFLLGDAFLVAPVTTPGSSSRDVALPSGQWTSLWAGDPGGGEGGTVVDLAAPLGRLPLLVRAGSIVPLDDAWAEPDGPCRVDGDGATVGGSPAVVGAPAADRAPHDDGGSSRHGTDSLAGPRLGLDHAPLSLAFHCWPDVRGDAHGVCVDDAGDGDGPVRRDVLCLVGASPGDTAVLTWTRRGDFPPPSAVRVVLHGLVVDEAQADGEPVTVAGSVVECGAFDELRLQGLRSVAPAPSG